MMTFKQEFVQLLTHAINTKKFIKISRSYIFAVHIHSRNVSLNYAGQAYYSRLLINFYILCTVNCRIDARYYRYCHVENFIIHTCSNCVKETLHVENKIMKNNDDHIQDGRTD